MKVLRLPSQSPDLTPTEDIFHWLNTNKTPSAAGTEDSCRFLAAHQQGRNPASGDILHGLLTSDSHGPKGFATKY